MNLFELMHDVAKHCKGWKWAGDGDDTLPDKSRMRCWTLTHGKTGARVFVRTDGNFDHADTGRLEFSPDWPRRENNYGRYYRKDDPKESHSITIGGSRTPQAIAKDLQHRLLDVFPTEFSERAKIRDDDIKDDNAAEKHAQKLAGLLGVVTPSNQYDREAKKKFSYYSASASVHVRAELSGSVTFERLTVRGSVGLAVVRAIRRELIALGELEA